MVALEILKKTGLLIATTNRGKFSEMAYPWQKEGVATLSLKDMGGVVPDIAEIETSYEGNAALKAHAYCKWSALPTLADDSGLEVMALGGRPGVRSARFAGENASDSDNLVKLLELMTNEEQRKARYVSFLYLVIEPQLVLSASACLEGQIAFAPAGEGGFGYDPIFIVSGTHRTLAELKERKIPLKTHRILAMEKLLQLIKARQC
jgi:XTP/dITP diphosphohydrolase